MSAAIEKAVLLAKSIKLLLLDVDGVLSDGQITYSSQQTELKSFHIHDGLGIKLLQRSGIEVGIITGRNSPMVARRAEELGIRLLVQGREDKAAAMMALLTENSLSLAQVAYMGDDLPDLAAICQAGLGITPADGVAIVRQHADLVTNQRGGRGAVREACEFILSAQGLLESIHREYMAPTP